MRAMELFFRAARGGAAQEAVHLGAAGLDPAALADDIAPRRCAPVSPGKLVPALYGALLKTEQDLHLFEKLAFSGQTAADPC